MPEITLPAKKKPELILPPEITALPEQVNTLASRVRLIEERSGELRKMLKLIEDNMLKHSKKAGADVRALNTDMNELKRAIITLRERLEAVISEIKLRAKKEDFEVLKRYIELWNVVKFVTHDQVEKIVEEKLADLRKQRPELFPESGEPPR